MTNALPERLGVKIHSIVCLVDGGEWIEFDSMINLRPASGNRSRGIDDPVVRDKIREIVTRLVQR